MKNDLQKILLVFFTGVFLFFLASLQISFINIFSFKFNIFLILILFLIISKNYDSALFLGWFGGFLIDTAYPVVFGTNSLIFIILTVFLIFFQKKALITLKMEGFLLMGIVSVFFYHFLEWAIGIIFISTQEKLSFYFLNKGIIIELFLTVILLSIIFFWFNKFIIYNKRALNV